MKGSWLLPDRLGARIALLLLGALLLEFLGNEWLFSRIEASLIAEERTAQVEQQIGAATRLALSAPEAERAGALAHVWKPPLAFSWHPARPVRTLEWGPASALLEARLGRVAPGLSLGRDEASQSLVGQWPLADGSWMSFRSEGFFKTAWPLHGRIAPVLTLLALVAVLALLLARLLGKPLRDLADAADRVGHDEPAHVAETGPREVRQVAIAFNAMQARLLAQVNERIQSLAAVSHDLRTPIARLRLRSATIRSRETREAIERDLAEMEAFIRSLMDYLRGADPEDERLIDLASIVMTIVHDAQDMGSEASYRGPGTLEVRTRPVKLQRAVSNLVQNAIRHGGSAQVRLAKSDGRIRIEVEDDGPGVPHGELEAVFEPFVRLEGSRNRNSGGAGLGLAIVRRSIERLGGTVRLENRLDGGLRATVELPG